MQDKNNHPAHGCRCKQKYPLLNVCTEPVFRVCSPHPGLYKLIVSREDTKLDILTVDRVLDEGLAAGVSESAQMESEGCAEPVANM